MSEAMRYKCPCCDGEIIFDSATQKMKCPYCENTFDAETLREYDEETGSVPEEKTEWEQSGGAGWSEAEQSEVVSYTCASCGGEIIGDRSTAATSCPYCGNPVIMKGQFAGALRPDWVIPFKLDKNAAKAALGRHLQGKRLLPKLFKDKNRIEEIKGITFRSGCLTAIRTQASGTVPPERGFGATGIIIMWKRRISCSCGRAASLSPVCL